MLIDIDKVQAIDRIRKDFGNIEELAQDIKDNGLINPPVVTPEFELIAGERRLRAMKHLGFNQIEVRVMSVKDEEHALNLEISENESRKDFSKLERLDYARRLERIERIKAKERQSDLNGKTLLVENFPQAEKEKGKTRDLVAEKIGIGSGRQYEKEKFIEENASPEILQKWDKGDISTHKAYIELQNKLESKDEKERELILQINAVNKQLAQHQSEINQTKELIKQKELEIENAKKETTTIFQEVEIESPKLLNELSELKKKLAQDRTEEYVNTIKQLENEIILKQSSVDNAIKNRDVAQKESERLRITLENNTKNDTEKFLMLIKDFINIQTSVINNDKIQNIKKQIFKIIEENK